MSYNPSLNLFRTGIRYSFKLEFKVDLFFAVAKLYKRVKSTNVAAIACGVFS